MKTCPKIHNGILLWRLGHAAVLRSDLVAPELIGGTMPFIFLMNVAKQQAKLHVAWLLTCKLTM